MTEITGGELFARALQAEGIEFLFGLPCPEIDPLLAQLEAHGIRLVPVRHEAAGVHMAEGLYKTTGKVAAVLGNPGPGSANLLPGVVTALHEGVPVLAITSSTASGSSTLRRPRRSRAKTSSTFSGRRSSGAAQSSSGRGFLRCCVWRSARCTTVARVRCTSSCRHRSCMRPATR